MRYRQDSEWLPIVWHVACWNSHQQYYRVRLPWQWALVDAERDGAVIQSVCSHTGGQFCDISTDSLAFDSQERYWRIKPAEPKRTPLTPEQMRLLVGQVAEFADGIELMVTGRDGHGNIQIAGKWWNGKEIMPLKFNGKPAYNETEETQDQHCNCCAEPNVAWQARICVCNCDCHK